ncbi:MAG: DUF3644 domain-containing protein [Salinibacterium sp.]|nr:DUF3644 domain-containing protein [Salinibacterium sp.]
MPKRWVSTLRTSLAEAALAVRLYNDSSEPRAFEAFVIHMHVAWLYALHARFERDGTDVRYRSTHDPKQFVLIDGEPKRWELARCALERWPDERDPVRLNLEFFIALRNKLEHRHDRSDANLAVAVSGHSQALLLNYESEVTTTFGQEYSLASVLRFPVFIGTFTTEGEAALRKLRNELPSELRTFIANFHSGLETDLVDDPRFELRLRVVLEKVNRDPEALSMQFTRWDDMSDEEKESVLAMGRRGQTVVREQQRSVVGLGLIRPQECERRVNQAIPFGFNSHHFLRAWQIKQIRPPRDSATPERTDERYCVFDALSSSYGYTEAWVAWLIAQCGTTEGFKAVTGRDPVAKQSAS